MLNNHFGADNIINMELMTADLTFSWLSLPQQWC